MNAKRSHLPGATVRPLLATDAEAAARLMQQLGYPHTAASIVAQLDAVPDRSSDPALVAVQGEHLLGLVTLHIARMLFHPAPVAQITTLVVDETARRLGIGRLLVDASADLAKAAGCQTLELTTGLHLKKAHAFYRSLGFESTSLEMARGLEDAPLLETPQ